jgi:hypothetical protein
MSYPSASAALHEDEDENAQMLAGPSRSSSATVGSPDDEIELDVIKWV